MKKNEFHRRIISQTLHSGYFPCTIVRHIAGIPKWLKGQAWKACRSVTRCQGSNPCSCAIVVNKSPWLWAFLLFIENFTEKIEQRTIKLSLPHMPLPHKKASTTKVRQPFDFYFVNRLSKITRVQLPYLF